MHDELLFSKESIVVEHKNSLVDYLKNENEMLKKKSIELNDIILNFTNGKKILDNLVGSQKCVFDKGGHEYKPNI